jgi:trypsin-like peptidase
VGVYGYRDRHRHGLSGATVRIVTMDANRSEVRYGTGFLVAPGLAVTCAHVVLRPSAGERVKVRYDGTWWPIKSKDVLVREPRVGAEQLYSHPDVALLRVPFEDHPCVPLTEELPGNGRQLYAHGFPVINNRAFDEEMWPQVVGTRKAGGGQVWINTEEVQVQPGASGSGAIDVATGELVGMLTQSRDPTSNLGVLLVPTSTIIATLAKAGHGDILDRNRHATQDMNTMAALRRRVGWALDLLAVELADATPHHLRAMVRALDSAAPAQVELDDATVALLDRDLDELGSALRALAMACHSPIRSSRLLGAAAPFASLSGRPLAAPSTAGELAAERVADRPRVVHLAACRQRSVDLLVGRARGADPWRALPLSAMDGVTDQDTGLPARLVRAVRAVLLDAAGVPFDPTDPDAVDAAWVRRGPRAMELVGKERGWLLVLPAGTVDSTTVELWREAFGPCMFLITDQRLSAGLAGSAGLLALPPSLAADDEQEVETRYTEIANMIESAAG